MKNIIRILLASFILVTPVWAYVTSRTISVDGNIVQKKWKNGFTILWRMNPTVPSNITGSREQAEVFRTSFAKWQAVSTASISFTEGSPTAANVGPGYDQINLISSNVSVAQYGSGALGLTLVSSFDVGGAGVIDEFGRNVEFPGQIMEADIMFNPQELFSTNPTTPTERYDLESVAVHEIGHLLGLDHTSIVGSTMFPTIGAGLNYAKTLSTDDTAGVSSIYPSSSFNSKGSISGTIRTMTNTPVYGAIVVAVNSSGAPVASAITNPSGQYTIAGLDAGSYTVYAEPMDRPLEIGNLSTLTLIYPGQQVFSSFTTRYR